MSAPSAPSIFESFNAKALAPAQVASTFVPSVHYERLAKRRHTVVIGPRGSGKTTLLRMLEQPTLEAWKGPDADKYRARIDFTGVYIASDLAWREQLHALGVGKVDRQTQVVFGTAAFTTHVLRAVVIAVINRLENAQGVARLKYRRIALSPEDEAAFVEGLVEPWRVRPQIPSLLALKYALSERLSDIRALANREALLGESGRPERLAGVQYLQLHFLQSALLAIERFNDLAGEPGARWALLFDELELAPQAIRLELMSALRGSDARLLFKLSMSPYTEEIIGLTRDLAPAPGHDYDQIRLWYPEKEEGYLFCRALWASMLKDRGLPSYEPQEVLGRSEIETATTEWTGGGTAYRTDSKVTKRLSKLVASDRSFREYLAARGIALDQLELVSGDERAATLRKVAPIVSVRLAFRTPDEVRQGKVVRDVRTRKAPHLYGGAEALFAIVEGNPRWFIGIVDTLLDGLGKERSIGLTGQSAEVLKACDRFRAMLRTIPSTAASVAEHRGLLGLLDDVADYIFNAVVREPFNPDPPGSFIVDSNAGAEVLASIGLALNAGAVIYVPDDAATPFLYSLRGKRFRLSYLLAPRKGFPIRLGRAVSLSSMLNAVRADTGIRQATLFPGRGDDAE